MLNACTRRAQNALIRRPPGRQRDQRAVPDGRPLLEGAHQGPADPTGAVLAADEDLFDPAHRPVGVEGEVPASPAARSATASASPASALRT